MQIRNRKSAMLLNFNHLQYMQIAESVLSKLPSSSLMPETHHAQQLRETKITAVKGEDETIKTEEDAEGLDEKAHQEENDEDLV
jgi:hypothetical protein